MNNLPRILLVDENPNDRKLASLVLAGEFGGLEIEAVGSAAEFSRAISAGRFGLVIIESRFTWSDGIELIRVVREVRADCPVILFTNEVGEELWSESLRHRVDAYVSKSSDGFVRLPSVVRSVFFRTRRKSVATSRDAPYRRLVESLPVGIFVATLGGEILEANPAFASLLGLFDPEEVAWSTFPDFFVEPAVADTWRSQIATARYVGNLDAQLKRADGTSMWARVSSWVVEDAGSGMRHVQGIVEATDDYQKAQQELAASIEKSHGLAKFTPRLVARLDALAADLQDDAIRRTIGIRRSLKWTFTHMFVRLSLWRTARRELRVAAIASPVVDRDRPNIMRAASRYIRDYTVLAGRVAQFSLYERLFALWHILHLPIFFLMVLSAFVHVFAVHAY